MTAEEKNEPGGEGVAWLLERGQSEQHSPTVWLSEHPHPTTRDGEVWTENAWLALMFPTREEAEAYAEKRHVGHCRAVEHGFGPSPDRRSTTAVPSPESASGVAGGHSQTIRDALDHLHYHCLGPDVPPIERDGQYADALAALVALEARLATSERNHEWAVTRARTRYEAWTECEERAESLRAEKVALEARVEELESRPAVTAVCRDSHGVEMPTVGVLGDPDAVRAVVQLKDRVLASESELVRLEAREKELTQASGRWKWGRDWQAQKATGWAKRCFAAEAELVRVTAERDEARKWANTMEHERDWERDVVHCELLARAERAEAERDVALSPIEAMDGSLIGRMRSRAIEFDRTEGEASTARLLREGAGVLDSAHHLRVVWREQVDRLQAEVERLKALLGGGQSPPREPGKDAGQA